MDSATRSIWSYVSTPSGQGRLKTECDVCIVGAGIAGLTTAYELVKAGKSVVVLDSQSRVANGETMFTTAHLASVLDDRFHRLISIRGADVARRAYESHAAAIDAIERIATNEQIDCDFQRVDGYLFLGQGDSIDSITQEEVAATQLGVPCERLKAPSVSMRGRVPCLRFPDQGRFHPLKYLNGLAKAITAAGGVLRTDTRVTKVEGGERATVTTQDEKTITARHVVIATNTPINSGLVLNSKLAAYTTYAIAAPIPTGSVPADLYWDTLDPYHYVRTQTLHAQDGPTDYLIVGGEDHKTGQAHDQAKRWANLEKWTRERFEGLTIGDVRYRWSGQVFETLDGLALIGREPGGANNVLIATGDSGMGLTHGTIAGLLLPELIQGQEHPWAELYDPSRTPVGAAKTFVEENANVVAQYRDWVTGGDVSSVEDVKPGTGATVRHGLKKIAVHCEENGRCHTLSATCPHMGGVVRWNEAEGTWDCPLHGSRFSATGKVLHGPAVDDLAEVEVEASTSQK